MLAPGEMLGKYRLDWLLGRGGMGEVWAAYDPDLDRRIAIKVMRSALASSADAHARLQREARAMGRLRHPNVITVHDATFTGGRALIAMELIDGKSLAGWLEDAHSRSEIIEVLLAAGRGLAAAHDAGMIHRDFKPHNVLVDRGGRAVVTDFGLVRAVEQLAAREPPPGDTSTTTASASPGALAAGLDDTARPTAGLDDTVRPTAELSGTPTERDAAVSPFGLTMATMQRRSDEAFDRGALDSPLTELGTLLGTPAYMAPEQLAGNADTRTDQFAFCVTAWEAMSGKRPFHAADLEDLAGSLTRAPAHSAEIPRRIRRVLARGLSPEPRDRWTSMHELLRALDRAWRRPRRIAIGIGAAAMVATVTAIIATRPATPTTDCSDATAELASVWSPAIRSELGVKITDPADRSRLIGFFERWDRQWRALHRQACAKPNDAGAKSLRVCLSALRDEVAQLVELRTVLPESVFASHEIPRIIATPAMCGHNPRAITPALPTDPTQLARVRSVRAELIRARARSVTADQRVSDSEAEQLVARARETSYPPVLVEAMMVRALTHDLAAKSGLSPEICGEYAAVVDAADAADHDRIRAEALFGRLQCSFVSGDPPYEIEAQLRTTEAAIRRLGDPVALAYLLSARGTFAFGARRWSSAIEETSAASAAWTAADLAHVAPIYSILEAQARIARHHDDDFERAEALVRSVMSVSAGDLAMGGGGSDRDTLQIRAYKSLRRLLWYRHRVEMSPPGPNEPAPVSARRELVVRVVANGRTVEGAEVVADRQPDVGTRVMAGRLDAPPIVYTSADGSARLDAPIDAVIVVRAGTRVGIAAVGASRVTVSLVEAATLEGEVTGLRSSQAADPDTASMGAARHEQAIVIASTRVGGRLVDWQTPVDERGRWRLVGLPPGRYAVSAESNTGLLERIATQTTVDTATTRKVVFAFDPDPGVMRVIVRPKLPTPGSVVAYAGAQPTSWSQLSERLAGTSTMTVSRVGPPSRPPSETGLHAGDDVAVLTRPGGDPITVCLVPQWQIPSTLPDEVPNRDTVTGDPRAPIRCRVVKSSDANDVVITTNR